MITIDNFYARTEVYIYILQFTFPPFQYNNYNKIFSYIRIISLRLKVNKIKRTEAVFVRYQGNFVTITIITIHLLIR